MKPKIKTTVVFLQPFELPTFNEVLPAGDYEIEGQLLEPADWIEPGTWASSVLVHLHPRESHPGLNRTLTVPLADLEAAIAKDKVTGKPLTDFFLEKMLDDPMIRLVMQADGVSETEVREFHSGRSGQHAEHRKNKKPRRGTTEESKRDPTSSGHGSARPGIGE